MNVSIPGHLSQPFEHTTPRAIIESVSPERRAGLLQKGARETPDGMPRPVPQEGSLEFHWNMHTGEASLHWSWMEDGEECVVSLPPGHLRFFRAARQFPWSLKEY